MVLRWLACCVLGCLEEIMVGQLKVVGVDVGGTFIDLIFIDVDGGNICVVKVLIIVDN